MHYTEKAKILIDEALPYLQKFKDKIVVIKYGGKAMINDELKESVIKDIAFLKAVGIKPVIVHGGGMMATKELEKQKIKPIFIRGLRVTSAQAIKIIEKVFIRINHSIQINLKKFGVASKGVYDCMHVEQKNKKLGFVGRVKKVDVKKIKKILQENKIPIISPLGMKYEQVYNVNADTAAVEIAIALKALKLTILTDIDGVIKNGKLVSHLSIAEAHECIEKGIITEGMIPKIEACVLAVKAGCPKAHLINGTIPHSLLFEIFTKEGIGTEIVENGT